MSDRIRRWDMDTRPNENDISSETNGPWGFLIGLELSPTDALSGKWGDPARAELGRIRAEFMRETLPWPDSERRFVPAERLFLFLGFAGAWKRRVEDLMRTRPPAAEDSLPVVEEGASLGLALDWRDMQVVALNDAVPAEPKSKGDRPSAADVFEELRRRHELDSTSSDSRQ